MTMQLNFTAHFYTGVLEWPVVLPNFQLWSLEHPSILQRKLHIVLHPSSVVD